MRWIEIPKSPASAEETKVEVHDPDATGVSHVYQIYGKSQGQWEPAATVRFKKTSSIWAGGGAATEEAILVVLIDRLQGVLKAGFTKEKAAALAKLQEAMAVMVSSPSVGPAEKPTVEEKPVVEPTSTPLKDLGKHLDRIAELEVQVKRLSEPKPKKVRKPKN